MEIQAINFGELRKYESFTNIGEMDESILNYTEQLRHDFPQSVVDVLWCLGKSSLSCVGLSFMKQATIAAQTNYSRKTVNKAIKTLESLGVIDSVRTKTRKGRPSVKIVRILPFCLERLQHNYSSIEAHEANNGAALTPIQNFESINLNHKQTFKTLDTTADNVDNKSNNSSVDKIDNLDVDQLNDFIPDVVVEKGFVDLAKPYFGTRKILSLSRVLQNGLKRFNLTSLDPYVPEAIKNAFKATVYAYKMNRIRNNFASYFFGTLSKELEIVKRKYEFEDEANPLFYNWLEA
ncbi:helix-turn-helix domain-containing protein [Peribacillus frigoritolerans]|uniref:helix-turn-helix domain-containing protein n=1 Tax=Peribacillus frigoritolerans TaxID=450367 RepID=UPI00301883D2